MKTEAGRLVYFIEEMAININNILVVCVVVNVCGLVRESGIVADSKQVLAIGAEKKTCGPWYKALPRLVLASLIYLSTVPRHNKKQNVSLYAASSSPERAPICSC